MGKGLYGQLQGNETRTAPTLLGDRIADNDVCESREYNRLRNLAIAKRWKEYQQVIDELRRNGWKHNRIQSLLTRSMAGIRL